MCTHVKGLSTTGVIVYVMHSRSHSYTGAGKRCLLRGGNSAGSCAALQPQAAQATHSTLHLSCSSLHTNQSLNPEALTLVGTANGAF